MSKRFLLYLILSIFILPCFAQEDEDPCQPTMDKVSEKIFKKARDLHKSGKKDEAYALYNQILEEHPDYLEVNYYYALGLYLPLEANQFKATTKSKSDLTKALNAYRRMYEVCPYYKIQYNIYAARLAYFSEQFTDAIKFATVVVENPDAFTGNHGDSIVEEAKVILKKAKFFDQVLNHPVPFEPKRVSGISTKADEYLGTLSPDGDYFYFTRRMEVPDESPFGGGETITKEFFSYSKRKGSNFGMGEPLPSPFNASRGEGSPTINITNDLIIFSKLVPTTINNHTYNNYDLYYSEFVDGDWTDPKSLGPNINRKDSWESQPSLSSDGKLLFFASDRPGSIGGSDIWFSERNSDGTWRKPVNLGPTINTAYDERSPFLHTDSKTLYFSSQSSPSASGHDGIGGQDIFYSKLNERGNWSKPVNLGYPINSDGDDVNFFVSLDGKTGYFCSRKLESDENRDDWNFYEFELYEDARPHTMIIVKGEVSADDDNLEGATVEIRDTATNVIATGVVSANNGNYAVATEVKKDDPQPVIVTVKKEGHTYDSQIIMPEQMDSAVVTKNAEIKSIETGKICDLRDIYYETNSYTLTPASKVVLALFIQFLKDNPTVKVEIQGHTDNVGNDDANLRLSEQRAKSVYDYVISKGIPASHLRYKGYGESQPIADNNTASGRAKNRRTVFLIYEK
ncbi:MAG: OmpA family protein [Bacteroidales bacterium]|nr:OmpA family protein [Bacteroidales bacterium]